MQNVEKPYKKESVMSAFFSLEFLAAVLCMAFFSMTIASYNANSSSTGADLSNSPDIVDQAMKLKPGVLAMQGKFVEATTEANSLIAKKKHDTLANLCVGNVFIMAGLKDDGLKYLNNAVSLSRRNKWVLENYAQRLADVGNTDDAIAQYEALEKVDPQWPKPHRELAKLYMATGRPADAANELKVVLDGNDKDFQARKMRGIALARANQLKAGLDEYVYATRQEAQTGIPDAVKSLLGTKGVQAIDRVTYELQQQVDQHPDEYVPKMRLAQLYEFTNTKENLDKAKDLLLDARRLQANNPEIQRSLAIVLKDLGEDNTAMSAFKVSVQLEQNQERERAKQGN